ncbi:MAG: MBOAT family protein [Deltaproteobacteria bacterium]|nr:MBOAT family protein [Deltaproteobacteria bacterium]MBI3388987.1 MBOAT family protein [Deltaproteobacteria bacterium]
MEITSVTFAVFVLAVLAIFYLLPARLQLRWLLLASYVFYATWSWQFALVLAALTLVNFAMAHGVRAADRPRRGVLVLGIAINIGVLAGFKYGDTLLHILASGAQNGVRILLPIGLSFYSLQAISYLVDVAQGQIAAETDFVAFALYLAYFPKLLAGPIERARKFLPQLSQPRVVDDAQLARSATLIAIGVVRKVVIADSLFEMIPPATFATPARASGLAVWLVAYSFALYNDFAGYTSLVRGVSLLFGIELSPNFASPYFARSFSEFWTRWHISLSQWLRDYIYLPLSRALLRRNLSRSNVPNLLLPPLTAMIICGMWHGEAWHFLAWGALHGVYLAGERVATLWRPRRPAQQLPAWRQALAMLRVFTLVALTLIPFRLKLTAAETFTRALLRASGWSLPDPRVCVLIALTLWIDWAQSRHGDELVFLQWPWAARAALLTAAVLAVLLVAQSDLSAPFVYQQF